jgi:hypothetical protein
VALTACLGLALMAGHAPHAAAATSARSAPSARGSTRADAPATPTITLLSQTPWVAPNGRVVVHVHLTNPPAGGNLTPVLHGSMPNRSALLESIRGTIPTGALAFLPEVHLPTHAVATTDSTVAFSLSDGVKPASGAITISNEGVYPLDLRVVDSNGNTVTSLVSYVVRLPTRPAGDQTPTQEPLRVGTVVPLLAPPSHRPDGSIVVTPAVRQEVRADLAALESPGSSAPPLDLVASPELLDALAKSSDEADQQLLAELDVALDGRDVLSQTYVDVDLPGYVAQPSLSATLFGLLQRGTAALATRLHSPSRRSWVLGLESPPGSTTATTAALTWLQHQGVGQVLVPDDSLVPVTQNLTGTQPFLLQAGSGHQVRALQVDAELQHHFVATDPVLGANQVVADLGVLALDLPGTARGAVLVPPSGTTPNPTFLTALRTALETATPPTGSGALPLVRPTTLDGLFATVPLATDTNGDSVVRQLRDSAPTNLSTFAARLLATTQHVDDYERLVTTNRPSRLTRDVAGLRTTVAVASSRDLGPVGVGRYLDAVDGHVAAAGPAVHLPDHQTVTLTSRTASIPFTIRNDMGGPITVELHLDAGGRLQFPEGDVQTVTVTGLVEHRSLRVRVTTPGESTLRIRVTSPGGGLLLGETRFVVRSTTISGVGLALTIGALVFLFVWWGRHVWRTRRNRRAARVRPADLITLPEPRPEPVDGDDHVPT